MADILVRPLASLSAKVVSTPPVCIPHHDHESAKRHIRELRGRVLLPWMRKAVEDIAVLLQLID